MTSLRDELRIGGNFLTFSFLRIFGQSLNFVVPLLVAKFLAPEVFGSYALSMMIAYLFSALFLGSTSSPFIVYASQELRDSGKINKSLSSWLIILAGSLIIYGLLSLLFARPLTQFAAIDTLQLSLLFLAFLGMGLRRVLDAVFLALDRKGASVAVQITTGVLSIVYLAIVYYFFQMTLGAVFLVFFAAPLTTFLFMFSRLERRTLFPFVFDKKLLKELLGHMKWTVLGGAAVYLFNWGDNIVLRYYVSLKDIGTYNLGYQIFKGITMFSGTISLYFLPFLARHAYDPEKIRSYLFYKRRKIMAAGSAGIVLFMAILPFLLRTFYGSTYEDTIPVALILLTGSFFVLYRRFYEVLLSARKQYRFTQLITVCFVALNIGLDVIFVTRIGAIGAAIATVITYVAYAAVFEVHYRRYLRRELIAVSD